MNGRIYIKKDPAKPESKAKLENHEVGYKIQTHILASKRTPTNWLNSKLEIVLNWASFNCKGCMIVLKWTGNCFGN